MFNIPENTKGALSLNDLNAASDGEVPTQMSNNMYGNQNMMENVQSASSWQQSSSTDNQGMTGGSQTPSWQQDVTSGQNMMGNSQSVPSWQQPTQSQQMSSQSPSWQQPAQVAQNVSQQNTNSSGKTNGVILSKGQKVSLTKLGGNLTEICVGLGWDLGPNGLGYDLDTEAFILGSNGRVIGDDWFVFYNQPASPDGSVVHSGDNKTGDGNGDDEVITINLTRLNSSVDKIVFVVTINEALQRGYNFSNIANAYVRVYDKITGRELVRFNLTDYYKEVTSMVVGELYKKSGEWRFNPVGNGVAKDLFGLCEMYGVNVAG